MQYKIEYTAKAKEDISSIQRYISVTLQNPVSANKIAKDILEKCKSLIILPKASRVRFHIHNFEIRFTKSHNYIIAYSVDDKNKKITIRAVIYNRRNIIKVTS